jgi:cytochrome c oxidase assembly protein subunit 15
MSASRWLRPVAWASLVANSVLVVTGGAVRLTGSGLGCPTWPRCTDAAYSPHGAYNLHSVIEFGNRMLTFVLVAVAIATLFVAWRTGRRQVRVLAAVLALAIPAQAVIGGITVLTDLNPWIVSLHLLLSLAMIAISVRLLQLSRGPLPPAVGGPLTWLAWATFASSWLVLYVGTVVTGSGPHAGDADSPRNGLSPLQTSQLHADLVFLLVGLTVGLLFAAMALHAPRAVVKAVVVLLVVELAQGATGFVQYFTGLPVVLVGFHLLGAAVIAATVTWAVLVVRHRPVPGTDEAELAAELAAANAREAYTTEV